MTSIEFAFPYTARAILSGAHQDQHVMKAVSFVPVKFDS